MSPRIALTQSEGRLEGLGALLEERGCEVVRQPLVETCPRLDDATRAAARALLRLPWVLVGSRAVVEALEALGLELHGPSFGAVGSATAAAIESAGGHVEIVGRPQNARGLARAFLGWPEATGPVGLPQGDRSLSILQDELGAAGFETRRVVLYETVTRQWADEPVDAIVLSSPSAVEALPESAARRALIVTLGPSSSRAARERGWSVEEARKPDPVGVLAALEKVIG